MGSLAFPPRIGVAFISDRADLYLPACRRTLDLHVKFPDGGEEVPTYIVDDRYHRLGMSGAVEAAWSWARAMELDYLLHVEEDFVFTAAVDVGEMVKILRLNPELAQLVLQRQPWSGEEHAAGGVLAHLGATPRECKACDLRWSTQTQIFSLNPCLLPAHVFGNPYSSENEAGMTRVLRDLGYEFGYLGHPGDVRVEHVGHQRATGWRL